MNIILKIVLYSLFLGGIGIASASDVQQQESTIYPYKNYIEIQDDFINTLGTAGSIGTHGWFFLNGTSVGLLGESNHPGLIRRTTGAASGTVALMALGTSDPILLPAQSHSMLWITRLNNNDTNTTVRIGSNINSASNPTAAGIYLEKLDADTNWFCVARSAGVQTRVDSTVAVTTNYMTTSYKRDSSGVQFTIDGVSVCGLITTNIPTVAVRPSIYLINSAASDKSLDVDYFSMTINISR